MRSQSLFAQVTRMTIILLISLIILHQSEELIHLIAKYAINFGCHQMLEHGSHH